MALDLKSAPASAPPRRTTPGRPANSTRQNNTLTPTQAKLAARQEGATDFLNTVQVACVMFGQFADAGTIATHGPQVAEALVDASDTVPQIGTVLDWLSKGGPLVKLAMAILPFGLQVLANHGVLDAAMLAPMGVVRPEVLAAKAQADMLEQYAAALQAQQEAEARIQAMTRGQNGTPPE